MKIFLGLLKKLIRFYELPLKTEDIQSVLVVDPNHLGDMLMATPVYRYLKKNLHFASVDTLIYDFTKIALLGNPYIDTIHTFPKGILFKQLGFLLKLRKKNYDLVFQLNTSLRTNILLWIIGKRYRLGYDYANRGFLNNIRVPIQTRTARVRYRVDESLELLEKAFGVTINERNMDFFVNDKDKIRVHELLQHLVVSSDSLLIGLHPHFRRTWKKEPEWEPQKYAGLIDKLVELYHATIVITGSQDDQDYSKHILSSSRHTEHILNFSGMLSLQELGALLLRVKIFISVNTGPMHVAIALNVPTIALMRATPPVITFPMNNHRFQYLVGTSEKPYDPYNLDYEGGSTINKIQVEDVVEKVELHLRLLDEKISSVQQNNRDILSNR